MPTYEYECGSCHDRFERLELMSARRRSLRCPRCGQRAKRLISGGAGLLFKGSGFYTTDYRSASYKKKAQEESKPRSPAPKGSDTAGAKKSGPS